MERFKNKICLVTGAGSGIGKATALAFAKEGATVIVADINIIAAEEVAAMINKDELKAIALKVDIARRSEVEEMIAKTISEFGRLDCAVNCAGIAGTLSLPTHEYPEDDWLKMIQINLTGT